MDDAVGPLTLLAGATWRRRRGGATRSSLAHHIAQGSVAAISVGDLLRQIPGIVVDGLPAALCELQLVADFPVNAPAGGAPLVYEAVVQARVPGGRWAQARGVRQVVMAVPLTRRDVAGRLCRQAAAAAAGQLGDPAVVRVSLLDADGVIVHQEYRSLADPRLRTIRHPPVDQRIPERGDDLSQARFRDPSADLTRLVATTIRRHVRQAARVARSVSVPTSSAAETP